MEDYESKREAFWEKYRELCRQVRRDNPGFWRELRELGEAFRASRHTTMGARVSEWPQTASRPTQTEAGAPAARKRVREVGTQWEARRAGPGWTDRGTQTDPVLRMGPVLEAWLEERPAPETRAGVSRPSARGGCWNCEELDHRYSDCRRPKYRLFCYGCGAPGVTLKECGNCGEAWRRAGPYRPDHGRDHSRP